MPLPLESGVQKDLFWPAMYAIEFTNFRPELFPDLFARYVFWLSYYAPSQQLYNLWLDFWNLTWTWRIETYAQGAWGGSSSAKYAGVFFLLRSGFRSFCTHTHSSVRCIMEAWRRRILLGPRLFSFCSVFFLQDPSAESSHGRASRCCFCIILQNWFVIDKFWKGVIFWKMKYQIFCLIIWSMFSKILLLLFFVPNLWI